jgi:GDSL/SGNH-like Acyl-Esterase family found in Pmr5 and Cas1p
MDAASLVSSPEQFLNAMRGTMLAFFADLVSRNHKDSLLCMLPQVRAAIMRSVINYACMHGKFN